MVGKLFEYLKVVKKVSNGTILSEARLGSFVQVGDSEARGPLSTFISKVLFNGLALSSLPGVISSSWSSVQYELLIRCDWKSAKVIRP